MASSVNIGGTWRQIAKVFVNINGAWRQVTKAFCNISNVWKTWFSGLSGTFFSSTGTGALRVLTKLDPTNGTHTSFVSIPYLNSVCYIADKLFVTTTKSSLIEIDSITGATIRTMTDRYYFTAASAANNLWVVSRYLYGGDYYEAKVDPTTIAFISWHVADPDLWLTSSYGGISSIFRPYSNGRDQYMGLYNADTYAWITSYYRTNANLPWGGIGYNGEQVIGESLNDIGSAWSLVQYDGENLARTLRVIKSAITATSVIGGAV